MAQRPKKPYSTKPTPDQYKRKDWQAAPKDSEKLETQGFRRAWHIVQPGENFVRIAAKYPDVDWQRLTRYNWGTDVPREINWYLEQCCGSFIKPTRDGKNYSFVGSTHPTDAAHVRGIWAPQKITLPFHRGQVLVPRSGTGIVDSLVCPYLSVSDNKCKHVADSKGASIDCGVPSLPDARFEYEIGKSQDKSARESVQTHDVESLWLHFDEFFIHRIAADGTVQESKERLTVLMFDFLSEAGKERIEEEREKRGAKAEPRGKQQRTPAGPLPTSLGGHKITNPDELRFAAQHLRNMKDAGILGRVVARGYADRDESSTLEESLAISKERALETLKALNGEFALTLSIEPDAGAKPQDRDLHNERIARGHTPVIAIGCGGADAPFGRKSPDHRVVILDPELKAAGPKEVPAKVTATQKSWVFYEFDPQGTWETRRSMLHAHCDSHTGACIDMKEVWACQREALACLDLLFAILGEEIDSKAIDYLKWRILEWDAHYTSQLELDFTSKTRKPFSNLFLVKDSKVPNLKGELVDEELITGLPGTYPVFMTETEPDADPDHWRSRGLCMSPSADASLIRYLPAPPEGTHAMNTRRIHFE